MAEWIGIGRRARRCYGFDEVALVPGMVTVNPNEVDTTWNIGDLKIKVPILAAAMDGVVDVDFAVAMGKMGGIAVLNLDGIQTRYDKPAEVLEQISKATPEEATKLVQSVYLKPVKENLIAIFATSGPNAIGNTRTFGFSAPRILSPKINSEIMLPSLSAVINLISC